MAKEFQDQVKNATTEQLQQMQRELQDKVESGKLSFGKKAANLLYAVMAGVGTGISTRVTTGVIGNSSKKIRNIDNIERKVEITSGIVGLGTIITGTILLNKQSRKAKFGETKGQLSFVEAELEKRAAEITNQIHGQGRS